MGVAQIRPYQPAAGPISDVEMRIRAIRRLLRMPGVRDDLVLCIVLQGIPVGPRRDLIGPFRRIREDDLVGLADPDREIRIRDRSWVPLLQHHAVNGAQLVSA